MAAHGNGPMALVQQGAPVPDLTPIDLSFIEDDSSFDSFEEEAEFSSPTLFELDDHLRLDLREDDESDAREYTLEAELDMSQEGSSEAKAEILEQSAEPDPAPSNSPQTGEVEFQPDVQAVTLSAPLFKSVFDDESPSPQPDEDAAVTDPWVDPLPAWDFSQNEWPVMVGPPKRRQIGMLSAFLGVLVLLAAGGFYFFILQPTLREQRAAAPVEPKGAERAAVVVPPIVPEAKPAEHAPAQSASPAPAETPAVVDSKPIALPDIGNNSGNFSLQAAAFPTQTGADEFSDKLRKAGLPSYIVSADLGRRGRWFRVRVGRFNSQNDAQKFAAEALLRAKTAGMSLELIGCQYDQPR